MRSASVACARYLVSNASRLSRALYPIFVSAGEGCCHSKRHAGRQASGVPARLGCLEHVPVFNDFASARKKYRVSRHEIAVFNGRSAENPLNTGNTRQFRLPSARKSLNIEYTCHETRYFLREGVETIEYRKFVPAKSCRQCQIVDYWNCAPAKAGRADHHASSVLGIRRPAGESPWRVSYRASRALQQAEHLGTVPGCTQTVNIWGQSPSIWGQSPDARLAP